MISKQLKANFLRGSREINENAVARQISVVFEETLICFRVASRLSHPNREKSTAAAAAAAAVAAAAA